MLWGIVHACYEEEGSIPSGQLVALPPQIHQPETHGEFEFSYIPAALAAVSGGSGSVTITPPPPGSIVVSGFAPTIEEAHPGVTT
jgi:hypothetical protein